MVVSWQVTIKGKPFRATTGAVLTILCGLFLWGTSLGDGWVNASYDYLFRFGSHAITNRVILIQMDNESYDYFHQVREEPWDRELHAHLLERLASDGCSLVVFDSFFRVSRDPVKDKELADALRRQKAVVLMAEQAQVTHPSLAGARPTLPTEPFLSAAGQNWGVAWLDPDLDSIVRRHWPSPSPGPYPSQSWTAARLAGADLSDEPTDRWLRYYGRDGAWTRISYRFALTQPAGYFHDAIVFIGTQPKTSVPDGEKDEFRVPYTRWTGETVGGVDIMITSFLNLVNGEWLNRMNFWIEGLLFVFSGALIGGLLSLARPHLAWMSGVGIAILTGLGGVSLSYFSSYWLPWLVIAGGQIPCAVIWALITHRFGVAEPLTAPLKAAPAPEKVILLPGTPDIPDYELVHPPFGQGAYGKVWLARNAVGQWQALKVVYLANFGQNADPYEREFNGIKRYKPISDKHPGLLRVDFVSTKKKEGYFYYVMELGDSLEPGWEREPSKYKPKDLDSARRRAAGHRLSIKECLRVGIVLADALDFLHRHGVTHRDIKPPNILFVNGQPKLADVGLMAEIRPSDQQGTLVGTPGYMPPAPESPGTPQADIYALGMVLYVLSTGHPPGAFPAISTALADSGSLAEFFPLNAIVVKACHPDIKQRYQSAAELSAALREAQKSVPGDAPDKLALPA